MKPNLSQEAVMKVAEGEELFGGWVTPLIAQVGIYKLLAKKKVDGTIEWAHFFQRDNGLKENVMRGTVSTIEELDIVKDAVNNNLRRIFGVTMLAAEYDIRTWMERMHLTQSTDPFQRAAGLFCSSKERIRSENVGGEAMNRHDQPYDWQRFWIYFVCGALLGAGIGLFFWFRHWHAGLSVWICIALPSLALALFGGIFGNCLWEGLLRAIGRWGWWV